MYVKWGKLEYPYFFCAQKFGGEFGCRSRLGPKNYVTYEQNTKNFFYVKPACSLAWYEAVFTEL